MSVRSALRRLERQTEKVFGGPLAECHCQKPIVNVSHVSAGTVTPGPQPQAVGDSKPILCERCGGRRTVINVQIVEVQAPYPPGTSGLAALGERKVA